MVRDANGTRAAWRASRSYRIPFQNAASALALLLAADRVPGG
jgi:hypothetical protein